MFTGMNALCIPTSTDTMNITSTSTTRHGMKRSLTPISIRTNRWSTRIRIILICTIVTVTNHWRQAVELCPDCPEDDRRNDHPRQSSLHGRPERRNLRHDL